jgi:hypothetical protein
MIRVIQGSSLEVYETRWLLRLALVCLLLNLIAVSAFADALHTPERLMP